jgi:hypothetical protein
VSGGAIAPRRAQRQRQDRLAIEVWLTEHTVTHLPPAPPPPQVDDDTEAMRRTFEVLGHLVSPCGVRTLQRQLYPRRR